ncbi:MAG TPA: glycosyltransferase family 39 protein [Candidatus Bathyarchaeia archaeon]|nr:glycosyltransferase family 39 protein [Candidatus Bathyarchaeia archaeon]
MSKKTRILNILVLLGVLSFVLLFRWNSFNSPFERDEGEYAYSAWILKQNILPYKNSFIQKPPMIIYTYLLSLYINPHALWPPRLLAMIFEAGSILLVGYILKKDFDKSTALIAMGLAIPMIMFFHLYSLAANTEKFMLLPLLGTLAVYTYNKSKKNSWSRFLFGTLSALAVFYKQICFLPILFIFLVWLIKGFQQDKKVKILLVNIFYTILGFLLTSWLILSPFILKDALSYVWECVIFFNKYYLENYGFSLNHSLRFLKLFLTNWWLLFFFSAWFFYKLPKNWWFYLGLFLTSLFSVSFSPLGHYYILIMPFWAMIASLGINSFATFLKKRKKSRSTQKTKVVITSILLVSMILAIKKQFFLSPEDLNLLVYTKDNPFIEASIVAKRITDLTSAKDYVYVLGCEPQILFYSKRKSPTRFFTNYPLVIESPKKIDYQRQTIADLKLKPPKAIVVSQYHLKKIWDGKTPKLLEQYMAELIENKYRLIGGFIWNDNQGYWQEPITNDGQKAKATLLLFIKNSKNEK